MPNPFALVKSMEGDVAVISLEGYLDAHTAPQFESAIQDEMDGGHTRIVVDCAPLTYISSAGLGVFMSFVEELREMDGDIKICALQPKVQSTFEVLGFAEIFDICDTREEAVARFAEPHAATAGEG